jgi:adenylate kinase
MIIFFGPAGAGKSIQGQMLAARHNWRWLSAGQLLRDLHDPELMKLMSEGKLVPDEYANDAISDALKRARDIDHVIIDGYPRDIAEAEWLLQNQEKHERAIQVVIVLNVSRDDVHARLRLRGRADDKPDVIDDRLEQYATETGAVLDLFTKHDIKIELVDGSGTVGDVHDRIDAVLEGNGIVTA